MNQATSALYESVRSARTISASASWPESTNRQKLAQNVGATLSEKTLRVKL